MRRVASVIRLKDGMEAEYRRLHADVWPEVQATLQRAHVSNYSIFLRDGLLFSYLEYTGDNYESDMQMIADDESTRRWWQLTDRCQEPVATAAQREWWVPAEEVFHL